MVHKKTYLRLTFTSVMFADGGDELKRIIFYRDSWHPWMSGGKRKEPRLQTSERNDQIETKQKQHWQYKRKGKQNHRNISSLTIWIVVPQQVGQKRERKLLVTQEMLLFWLLACHIHFLVGAWQNAENNGIVFPNICFAILLFRCKSNAKDASI